MTSPTPFAAAMRAGHAASLAAPDGAKRDAFDRALGNAFFFGPHAHQEETPMTCTTKAEHDAAYLAANGDYQRTCDLARIRHTEAHRIATDIRRRADAEFTATTGAAYDARCAAHRAATVAHRRQVAA